MKPTISASKEDETYKGAGKQPLTNPQQFLKIPLQPALAGDSPSRAIRVQFDPTRTKYWMYIGFTFNLL